MLVRVGLLSFETIAEFMVNVMNAWVNICCSEYIYLPVFSFLFVFRPADVREQQIHNKSGCDWILFLLLWNDLATLWIVYAWPDRLFFFFFVFSIAQYQFHFFQRPQTTEAISNRHKIETCEIINDVFFFINVPLCLFNQSKNACLEYYVWWLWILLFPTDTTGIGRYSTTSATVTTAWLAFTHATWWCKRWQIPTVNATSRTLPSPPIRR